VVGTGTVGVHRRLNRCQFSETLDQFFSHDVVLQAITPEVTPLFAVPQEDIA
jgi:hypothetical protein